MSRQRGSDRAAAIGSSKSRVVRIGDDHEIVDEWTTLVDPGQPVRCSRVHGIHDQHVRGAPTFADIAGDVADRLGNNVVVAHNARFDAAFVEAEFRRVGFALPCEWLCTLQLVRRLGFSPTRSLRACCESLGVTHDDGHATLVDARATARLLIFLLAAAYDRELSVLLPAPVDRALLPQIQPCGRCVHRSTVMEGRAPPLRRAVRKLVPPTIPEGADPSAVVAYTELLDRVLEDGMVSSEEGKALCELAVSWNLTSHQAMTIHRHYLSDLVSVAMADGVLSREEHENLRRFADVLGVDRQVVLDQLMSIPRLPGHLH